MKIKKIGKPGLIMTQKAMRKHFQEIDRQLDRHEAFRQRHEREQRKMDSVWFRAKKSYKMVHEV